MLKMNELTLNNLQSSIINTNLSIKALINDINECEHKGTTRELTKLNEIGRSHISNLRKYIEELEYFGKEQADEEKKMEVLKEVKSQKEQLNSTLAAFQKANVQSMLSLEKRNKEELFSMSNTEDQLTRRHTRNNSTLLKQNSTLTDQMLSVSRQLAETTKQSADALETLLKSSHNITAIHEELKTTRTHIDQSGKLLDKYQQRQFTDKILILFAFSFFMACVLYVFYSRI